MSIGYEVIAVFSIKLLLNLLLTAPSGGRYFEYVSNVRKATVVTDCQYSQRTLRNVCSSKLQVRF